MVDLRVTVGSLTLANPVLVAAGTFGYGVEFADAVRLDRLGAIVTKTLTRRPCDGQPPPRLIETPSGMLNAVGLQNMGLDAFLRDTLPALRASQVPVIVSVLGESVEDLEAMLPPLDAAPGVAAIEINLSCPNLRRASERATRQVPIVAQDAEASAAIIRSARRCTAKPLIAKLSPDVTDLAPIAQAVEREGADAIALVNTFVGMSIDPQTGRSRLGAPTGGLSGPAIRPLAVYRVWYTVQNIRIPVIGIGGIMRADDALEFLIAGASAVAVGTANFVNPRTPLQVLQGITRFLERRRLPSVRALSGSWCDA